MDWREMSGVMIYNPDAESYRVNAPPAEGAMAQFDVMEYKIRGSNVLVSLVVDCGTRLVPMGKTECADDKSARDRAYKNARKLAQLFIDNLNKYPGINKEIKNSGPKL